MFLEVAGSETFVYCNAKQIVTIPGVLFCEEYGTNPILQMTTLTLKDKLPEVTCLCLGQAPTQDALSLNVLPLPPHEPSFQLYYLCMTCTIHSFTDQIIIK